MFAPYKDMFRPQPANYAVCHTCQLKHPCSPGSVDERQFFSRHRYHATEQASIRPSIFDWRGRKLASYGDNASIKMANGTATAFTKTNANIATSATAGWKSNSIDNSGNLYLDAGFVAKFAAVNTAPGSTQGVYFFAYSLIEGTSYASTGDGTIDGTEGTVTLPNITTLPNCLPLLGLVPYPVQNKAINSRMFSVAKCFDYNMPMKWGVVCCNHSGMTLSVTDYYYIELYNTVA